MIMTVFLIGIALSMLISNSIFNCYMKYFQRLTNLCQYFQNHLDLDQTSAEQIQFRIWMLAEVIISNVFQTFVKLQFKHLTRYLLCRAIFSFVLC